MNKIFIHFEKNNLINKKIVVTGIWVFSLIALTILFTITYQELTSGQIMTRGAVLEPLAGVTIGTLLILGLLSSSKVARWIILLIAYLSLLTPFVEYIMLKLFVPKLHNGFSSSVIIMNIIMSIFIITLLTNRTTLKLYFLKKDKKSRIEEQVYLAGLTMFLMAIYTYYIYIPSLYKSSLLLTI